MKKRLFLMLSIIFSLFFLPKPVYSTEESIGDFFHNSNKKYKIEFEVLSKKYNVDSKIEFYRIGEKGYQASFFLDKNRVKYIVQTTGYIYNNRLYPLETEEQVKIFVFNYTTRYDFYYDRYYHNRKVVISGKGSTGFPWQKVLTDFSEKNQTTEFLSGILQLIYWCHSNKDSEAIDIVRDDYVLYNLKLKIYEKNGVKYAILDKKQEEDFDLHEFLAKIDPSSWPEEITVSKHWILKNILISLIH
jgi:hypothetical protein